jgi:hypothetical protein
VTDRGQAIAVTLAGAVLGGAAAYVLFTEPGRSLRRRIEPALDDLARELDSFRGTVARAATVATEGWRLLNEALSEEPPRIRHVNPHQTTPF